ncbi:MAG: hypothetical protein RIQ60_1704 [Pseudomonadota bacterium]|jgi:enamine deaminase RidA (YjgF/YER057c/UK114 family)
MSGADNRLREHARALGLDPDGEIKRGGNYVPVLRDEGLLYVSGQVPRVGDVVQVTGSAGAEVELEQARHAARICVLRALILVQREAGSLDAVQAVPRMTVFVRSASDFTRQSEVADAASDLAVAVLGPRGVHTRTSVGVAQLPKGATVELDLVVRLRAAASPSAPTAATAASTTAAAAAAEIRGTP